MKKISSFSCMLLRGYRMNYNKFCFSSFFQNNSIGLHSLEHNENFIQENSNANFKERNENEALNFQKKNDQPSNSFKLLVLEFKSTYTSAPTSKDEKIRSDKVKKKIQTSINSLSFFEKNKIDQETLDFLNSNKIYLDNPQLKYDDSEIREYAHSLLSNESEINTKKLTNLYNLIQRNQNLSFSASKEVIEILQYIFSEENMIVYNNLKLLMDIVLIMKSLVGIFQLDLEHVIKMTEKLETYKKISYCDFVNFFHDIWNWDNIIDTQQMEQIMINLLNKSQDLQADVKTLMKLLEMNLKNKSKEVHNNLTKLQKIFTNYPLIEKEDFSSILDIVYKRRIDKIPIQFYTYFLEIYLLNKYQDISLLAKFILCLRQNEILYISDQMKMRIESYISVIISDKSLNELDKIKILLAYNRLKEGDKQEYLVKCINIKIIEENCNQYTREEKNLVLNFLKDNQNNEKNKNLFQKLFNTLMDFENNSTNEVLETAFLIKDKKNLFQGQLPSIEMKVKRRINGLSINSLTSILKCGKLFSSELIEVTQNSLIENMWKIDFDSFTQIIESLSRLKINNPVLYTQYEKMLGDKLENFTMEEICFYLKPLCRNKMGSHDLWIKCETQISVLLNKETNDLHNVLKLEIRKNILNFFNLCAIRGYKCESLFDTLSPSIGKSIQSNFISKGDIVKFCDFLKTFKIGENKLFHKINQYFILNVSKCNAYEFYIVVSCFHKCNKGSKKFWDLCNVRFREIHEKFNIYQVFMLKQLKFIENKEELLEKSIEKDLERTLDTNQLSDKLNFIAEKRISFLKKEVIYKVVDRVPPQKLTLKSKQYFNLMK